jgi:hypothetical protein
MCFAGQRTVAWLAASVWASTLLASVPAAAQDPVVIEHGYLDLSNAGPIGSGDLRIGGTRGFTFTARVRNEQGEVGSAVCELGCAAGTIVDLTTRWSGTSLPGVATLDGIVYPAVGDIGSMSVQFSASVVISGEDDGPSRVLLPFTLSGAFSMAGEDLAISGSGTADVGLARVNDGWAVARVTYTFGPVLPDPWSSNGTSEVPLGGTAMFATDMFVVGGTGDFWGTVDSGHLVWTAARGNAEIVARVRDQSSAHPFAKAGVMIRQSLAESAPHVIFDVKPDGGLEFMTRPGARAFTTFVAGGFAPVPEPWLRLTRDGDVFTGSISADRVTWAEVGTVNVPMGADVVTALAVSSHDFNVRNTAVFDDVSVTSGGEPPANLLSRGNFEEYEPPMLGPPGWISDHLLRQVPAKSEMHQPRSGLKNGACWTPEFLDCGIYQEVSAPSTGRYTFSIYASADRSGGLVGANVNGATAASNDVEVRPFGEYALYTMTFTAQPGDTIRVWMYSPALPGYVVIDDASLRADAFEP